MKYNARSAASDRMALEIAAGEGGIFPTTASTINYAKHFSDIPAGQKLTYASPDEQDATGQVYQRGGVGSWTIVFADPQGRKNYQLRGTGDVDSSGNVSLHSLHVVKVEQGKFLVEAAVVASVFLGGVFALQAAHAPGGALYSAGAQSPSTFEGFNFSSGEATTAVTDAQEVSYGFNGSEGFEPIVGPERAAPYGDLSTIGDPVSINATPESIVSDFGTVSDPAFSQASLPGQDFGVSGDSIRMSRAAEEFAAASGKVGQVAGGGSFSAKAIAAAVGDIGTTGVAAVKTAAGVVSAGAAIKQAVSGTSNTATQKTTAVAKSYTGQLGEGTAGEGGTSARSWVAPIALALVAAVAGWWAIKRA